MCARRSVCEEEGAHPESTQLFFHIRPLDPVDRPTAVDEVSRWRWKSKRKSEEGRYDCYEVCGAPVRHRLTNGCGNVSYVKALSRGSIQYTIAITFTPLPGAADPSSAEHARRTPRSFPRPRPAPPGPAPPRVAPCRISRGTCRDLCCLYSRTAPHGPARWRCAARAWCAWRCVGRCGCPRPTVRRAAALLTTYQLPGGGPRTHSAGHLTSRPMETIGISHRIVHFILGTSRRGTAKVSRL